jgi:glycosyltransferase involved in cell wall biosynthesis
VAEQALNVLHVGPDIGTTGGMSTVISLLSRATVPGIRATSVTTWRPDSPTRGLFPTAGVICRLALRRGHRPDWVHAHLSEGGSFLREGAVLVAAQTLGIKAAATLHGAQFISFSQRHPGLVRRVLTACSVVFPLGPRAASRVSTLSPGTQVQPVLNPVDLDELADAPALGRGANVVFGGEVGRRKGIDRLVAAWPEVRKDCPEATCVVCGPPGDFPLGDLPDGMTYAGALSRDELLGVLKSADVACLPSRDEALPMFILESLGLGVPVVTTPVGEIGQLGEAQGVALTDGEPEDLAARLVEFLSDAQKRRQWGARAALWTRQNCSVDAVGRALATSYRAA